MHQTWSEFRMGWLMVIFDLPTNNKEERRSASRFRNDLKDDGFLMLQYSVYIRPCVTIEVIEKHAKRIEGYSPPNGQVKILFFTDNQWSKSITIETADYRPNSPDMPEQMEFW